MVRGEGVLQKLFGEMAERYRDREGGYTRILRTRRRANDAAHMAYIECAGPHAGLCVSMLLRSMPQRVCMHVLHDCTLTAACGGALMGQRMPQVCGPRRGDARCTASCGAPGVFVASCSTGATSPYG